MTIFVLKKQNYNVKPKLNYRKSDNMQQMYLLLVLFCVAKILFI